MRFEKKKLRQSAKYFFFLGQITHRPPAIQAEFCKWLHAVVASCQITRFVELEFGGPRFEGCVNFAGKTGNGAAG